MTDAGDPADAFEKLLGRQATDAERRRLYRVRDALGLRSNDAIWLILIALEHYSGLYDRIPGRIEAAIAEALTEFGAAADAQAEASTAGAQRALVRAVADSAAQVARNAARANVQRSLAIAICVAAACALAGFFYLDYSRTRGYKDGYAAGRNAGIAEARHEGAAASWANTPEGRLAYGLAEEGSLRALATCGGPGWKRTTYKESGRLFCLPHGIPETGKVHGWWMATPPPAAEIPASK